MLRQKNARKKSVIQFHVLNVCHVKQTGLTVFERCQNGNKKKNVPLRCFLAILLQSAWEELFNML